MTATTTTAPMSAMRRLLSISAAATLTAVGLVAFAAPAHAADADSKVWVCKYVGTPGSDETLQTGDNPIFVSGHAVDKDKNGKVFVGDQFADAQTRSVIVQIEGEDPGIEACSPTPPPVVPTEGPTPGTGAPHTGGEGSGHVPVGLVGGGSLLVGAALVAAGAERRRRAATHR
jgi:hypothetical protein